MKNVLLVLLFVVLSGVIWAQDVEIVKDRLGTYQIYEVKKVLIGSLVKVDPNVPVDKLVEIYQRGLSTYDSVVIQKNYNYKHFWLTRNADVSYKIGVFVEKDREIKTVIQSGPSKQILAVDIYIMLFCFLITVAALSFASARDYKMKRRPEFYVAFSLSAAFCVSRPTVNFFQQGYHLLDFIISAVFACLLIYFLVKRTDQFLKDRALYVKAQWLNIILIIITTGIVAKSFLLPVILIVIFFIVFNIIIKTASIKIVKTTENKFVDEEY